MTTYYTDADILNLINKLHEVNFKTLEDAVTWLLTSCDGNMAEAARKIGVTRWVFANRARKVGIKCHKPRGRTGMIGNSLPRIETTFDLDGYMDAVKKNPEQSVCKFCSNKNGNKHNLTCIKECLYRSMYAQAQIEVDIPAHFGVSSFAKTQFIIPKGKKE